MGSQFEALDAALRTIDSLDDLVLRTRSKEIAAIWHRLTKEPSGVDQVVDRFHSARADIEAYLHQTSDEAVSHDFGWDTIDTRLIDVGRLDSRSATSKERFRHCLAQRSLTLQCANWETQTYGNSRLSMAIASISCLKNRKEGHIQEFIENHGYQQHASLVSRAIQSGIRMLWLEHELQTPTISAMVSLSISQSRVRNLPIKELPKLVEKLKNCPWILSLSTKAGDWFAECELDYNGQ